MVHVKQQKKMASVSPPPQEQTIACVSTNTISRIDDTTRESREIRPPYPERLNAEELISQINCRTINNTHTTTTNDINNDSNNNSNTNNTSTNRNSNQHTCRGVSIDLEKGPIRRHHRHQRPLYRRVFNFIRNLWIGAKFSVSKDGKRKYTFLIHNINHVVMSYTNIWILHHYHYDFLLLSHYWTPNKTVL